MARVRAILFDLDGTLIPLDTDLFIQEYFRLLARHMGHLIPPAELAGHVMASTYAMIANTDPGISNGDAFFADFCARVGLDREILMPLFDEFYRVHFPTLRSTCLKGDPAFGRRAVEVALELGYDIILATNPLFPRAAIEERMRWGGLLDFPWRLVTALEDMHFCKPQPGYYAEVLSRTGYRADECLMVGNDVEEDGVAARLGLSVYIVTDFLINRKGGPVPAPSGTMAEFVRWLQATRP